MVADGVIKKFIPVDLGAEDVEEQIVAAVNGLVDEVITPACAAAACLALSCRRETLPPSSARAGTLFLPTWLLSDVGLCVESSTRIWRRTD